MRDSSDMDYPFSVWRVDQVVLAIANQSGVDIALHTHMFPLNVSQHTQRYVIQEPASS
jgi:hypothetical protein